MIFKEAGNRLVLLKNRIDRINPVYVGLFLLAVFSLFPILTWKDFSTSSGDIAQFLNNPFRVLNGEKPYRDFWICYPPGEIYLPYLVYSIFGPNINAALILNGIISVLIGLASFILGRLAFRDNVCSALTASMVLFNGVPARYLGIFYNHTYFLLLIVAAIFLFRHNLIAPLKNLFFSGVFTGAALFFRFFLAGSELLAASLSIITLAMLNGESFGQVSKKLVSFFAGFVVIVALVLLALYDILGSMLRELLLESAKHGTSMPLPYLGLLFDYPVHSVLPFVLIPVSACFLFFGNAEKRDIFVLMFFLLWGLFSLPQVMVRSSLHHLSLAVTPLFFVLSFTVFNRNCCFRRCTRLVKASGLFLIPAFVFLFGRMPLNLITYIIRGSEVCCSVTTNNGKVFFKNEQEKDAFENIVRFIKTNSAENDYIYVTPWHTQPLYVLTGRKCPSYYTTLVDLVARPSVEKQKRVCTELKAHNTKIIVHDPDWGFDNRMERRFSVTCPILQKYIEDNYRLVGIFGRYWIYTS